MAARHVVDVTTAHAGSKQIELGSLPKSAVQAGFTLGDAVGDKVGPWDGDIVGDALGQVGQEEGAEGDVGPGVGAVG